MRRQIITFLKSPRRSDIILNEAKGKKQTIYGARSIQAQLGIISRQTKDWDIFSDNPKKDAVSTEKKLDKFFGFDYHYTKEGKHKGTYKVKGKGYDLKKGTPDDEEVVDYTKIPKPKPKTVVINGVAYRDIKEEIKRKKEILKDKSYQFRHKKDRLDLGLIESVMMVRRM